MTHTTKHTPGPWVAVSTFNGTQLVETQNGCSVCVLADDNDATNATLIAAAPAMYEALQDIVEGLTDEITHMVEGSKPDTARLDYLANKAGLALAQAEGKHD